MSAESGKAQPVGFCSLTESGRVEYCDGKPMFMAGHIGNHLHPVALYPHPDPVRAALVEALKVVTNDLACLIEDSGKDPSLDKRIKNARAALRAAGRCCHE